MPYCTNCGRQLNDGEICSCTAPAAEQPAAPVSDVQQTAPPAQQPYSGYPAPQNGQPYNNGNIQPPPYPNNGGQPFPPPPSGYMQGYPQPYYGQPMPPKKESKAWILAIIIPVSAVFLLIIAILAAIFVPAMLGYTKKSKISSMASKANSLSKAASSALVEMDENGEKVNGYFIISSDSSKNVAVACDVGEFKETTEKYFGDLKDYDYFIVCRNGYAEYAAISTSWTNKKDIVGSYPGINSVDNIAEYNSQGYSKSADRKNKTLRDLYDTAVNEFELRGSEKSYY